MCYASTPLCVNLDYHFSMNIFEASSAKRAMFQPSFSVCATRKSRGRRD
ncbi:hypothetical protein HMPREF1870_01000 [Bacteroidales bacterium KA00344]|nr:hypothetical protein HMPREF1870_01000 [Bacteroidales bacterium KA00344]